ncbi:hypothetical protein E5288_WYG000074 [Bos mutus]|uniref:Uncharacterized protein n=1 Tax=Bos mutus TaxID=72004 RepID=A0A6B0RFP8_9CETA|nr:hypothetical protein [Bos mutus]
MLALPLLHDLVKFHLPGLPGYKTLAGERPPVSRLIRTERALGVSLSMVPALGFGLWYRGQVQALGPRKDFVMVHSCPGRRSGSSANLGKTCWHGIFPVHMERCLIVAPPSGMYMESVPFARTCWRRPALKMRPWHLLQLRDPLEEMLALVGPCCLRLSRDVI